MTYINGADDVVVRKVTEVAAPHVSFTVSDGLHSGLTAGMFVGPNSDFELVQADCRASEGPISAYGIIVHDARQSYTVGTFISGNKDFKRVDVYEDNFTIKLSNADITLSQGPIWLSSGGGITQNEPDVTGDLKQQVGWAVSEDEFVVNIQTAETYGA